MQDGNVIYESYANGDERDQESSSIFSGTKGFWCVAGAAAVQDGILDSMNRFATLSPSGAGIRIKQKSGYAIC